jgi:hypothetical protein
MDPLKERELRSKDKRLSNIYRMEPKKGRHRVQPTHATTHSRHDNAWRALTGAETDGGVTGDGGEKSCG